MPAMPPSQEPIERVFPIRLSILENSPFLQHSSAAAGSISLVQVVEEPPGTGSAPDVRFPPADPEDAAAGSRQDGDATSASPEITMTDDATSSNGAEASDSLYTDRFEYAVLDDGSHGVVQGTRRVHTRCEDEQIHLPGAIQSYGMLIALKRHAEGVFVPRIVSENSYLICRYQPRDLFAFDSFNQVMPIYQRSLFNTHLRAVRRIYDHKGKEQEPAVFAFSFFDPDGRLIPCWCAAHYRGDADLYICEFELQDFSMHPLATPMPSDPPRHPIDTLGSDHMDIATVSSLQSKSQPILLSPDVLSQGINPDTTSVEIVGIATKIQQQFSEAPSVPDLLETIAGVVKELTGFNRVMVYEFDQDFNGTVVAELLDPKVSQDIYRGLHFPASDIPPQARRLYMINKVRVLFDRTQQSARLVGRNTSDIESPLDLTHAYLRAMSPIHLRYLINMGVRSSMSMSLVSEGKLWGLIVCHSYGPAAPRVPFSVRELCSFIGVAASTCLEKLLNSRKLQARRILDTLSGQKNPNECITASSDELLKLFEADSGFLVVEGEARTIGRLSSYMEALTLLRYLFFRRPIEILYSSNVSKEFKDMHYPMGFQSIAGVLYIPLGITDDCVVFFRKNQLREVHWAGRPSLIGDFGTLEPRNSFRKWTEVVHGTSKNWTPESANIAAMAQLVYGSFIRVWREKEAAVKETRVKRLLLHDASHQVRTPLNAVINYLEMAMEKPLEESTKQALQTSYTASKSLIYVIDDLLNLTGSTTGSIPLLSDPFDIATCIEETLQPLKRLGGEKGVELVSRATTVVSRCLRGDPPNLQRAISILVANAIEHTRNGKVVVEWGEVSKASNASTMRIAVIDFGLGLSERELDDMFQEFEQVPDEDFDESSLKGGIRNNVLRVGVGLAFVARYVKQRNGQLKVVSVKEKGSTFAIELPFLVVSRTPTLAARRDASPLPALPMPSRPTPAPGQPASVANITSSISSTVEMSPPIFASTPRASPMDSAAQTPATNHLTVLIADDNIINVQILKRRLSKLGHRVLVSRDGQECYNIFVSHQATVDFVLMDLNMPIVDGWASTRMIREQEQKNPTPSHAVLACGRTPVFAVSGMLRRGDEARYMEAGFDGWMPKPIDMRRMVTYLAGAWDSAARTRGAYDEKQFELGGWFPRPEPPPPPTPAPVAEPPAVDEYPPLPETPANQGYQIWEQLAAGGKGTNPGGAGTPRLPHRIETIAESGVAKPEPLQSVQSETVPTEVVGTAIASPKAEVPPPTVVGKEADNVVPGTPECPPIASPWRLD